MKWVVAINSAIPAAIIAIKPNRADALWLAWLAAIVAVIGGLFIPHYASRMNGARRNCVKAFKYLEKSGINLKDISEDP